MAQIICRDLSFAYDGETVLSDINFSLDAGSSAKTARARARSCADFSG